MYEGETLILEIMVVICMLLKCLRKDKTEFRWTEVSVWMATLMLRAMEEAAVCGEGFLQLIFGKKIQTSTWLFGSLVGQADLAIPVSPV